MNNSFKKWLTEDGEMLDGAAKIIGAVAEPIKKGFQAGVAAGHAKAAAAKDAASNDEKEKVIDFINKHTANLFQQFPYTGGAGGPEDFLRTFETRSAALQGFEIYKNMAKTLGEIQNAFNKRLVQTKKVDAKRLKAIMARAKSDAESGMLDSKVESFAKSEARFFTELLMIQKGTPTEQDDFDKYEFDRTSFISRLSNRFSKTSPQMAPLAIESLNTLFIYLIEDFTSYAKTIAEAGKQRAKDGEAAPTQKPAEEPAKQDDPQTGKKPEGTTGTQPTKESVIKDYVLNRLL